MKFIKNKPFFLFLLASILLFLKKLNIENEFFDLLYIFSLAYGLSCLLSPDEKYISDIANKLRKRKKIGDMKRKNNIEIFKVILDTIIYSVLFFRIIFMIYQIFKVEYYNNDIIKFILALLLALLIIIGLVVGTLFFNFKCLKAYLKISKIIKDEK
ncbi:MAG: hypothetical protein SOY60_05240 [Fusobacterium gastrosuis]|uniref:hypothetical protein n=1 Tax=Fusobacterium gastrosuis TaxID=1755100 RepID=UPI00297092B7|nr:hypothetical protein [Fusobacteriaceae bacterium]MDY4011051.1 hypothetical protein [Fusobacterium gastrosuis]MDY5714117.1 hypothetical protein [Fusobacterium gastrosuis]